MHFSLPKPLHGWREFAGEVGIIVVGVIIALSAEQVVAALHWRNTLNAERKVLNAEVYGAWSALSGRKVVQPCIDHRFNDLAVVFARHSRGEPLGIIAPVGRPLVWPAGQAALRMATADGSLSHMSMEEKQAYFGVAGSYDSFSLMALEERTSWRTLEALNDPVGLTEVDWRELRKAYRDAVDTNRIMKSQLTFGSGGWLHAFSSFGSFEANTKVLSFPAAQELCKRAVKI